MDYSSLPIFNLMKHKLNFHSARQGVLAQNIANADTPDYKAKEVLAPDFGKLLEEQRSHSAQKMPASMMAARTHAGHLQGVTPPESPSVIKRKLTDELNPNGNNIVIEEEMAEVAKNQGEYIKMLNLYSKTLSLFRTAIGNPGSNG